MKGVDREVEVEVEVFEKALKSGSGYLNFDQKSKKLANKVMGGQY